MLDDAELFKNETFAWKLNEGARNRLRELVDEYMLRFLSQPITPIYFSEFEAETAAKIFPQVEEELSISLSEEE